MRPLNQSLALGSRRPSLSTRASVSEKALVFSEFFGKEVNKKVAIVQSNYIPWKGYFDLINSVDEFILFDDVQYTKRDWRNRNRIKTPNGTQWLSIPVQVKGRQLQLIRETQVSDPDWGATHWKTLQQSYKKMPYFELYRDKLAAFYLDTPSLFLSVINKELIELVCGFLGIKTQISASMDYHFERNDKTEQLVHICRQANAKTYVSGPAAQSYMDLSSFSKVGIDVTFFQYVGYPEYNQPYPPFEHAVTILDLLFAEGPNARRFMKSFSENDG